MKQYVYVCMLLITSLSYGMATTQDVQERQANAPDIEDIMQDPVIRDRIREQQKSLLKKRTNRNGIQKVTHFGITRGTESASGHVKYYALR